MSLPPATATSSTSRHSGETEPLLCDDHSARSVNRKTSGAYGTTYSHEALVPNTQESAQNSPHSETRSWAGPVDEIIDDQNKHDSSRQLWIQELKVISTFTAPVLGYGFPPYSDLRAFLKLDQSITPR